MIKYLQSCQNAVGILTNYFNLRLMSLQQYFAKYISGETYIYLIHYNIN